MNPDEWQLFQGLKEVEVISGQKEEHIKSPQYTIKNDIFVKSQQFDVVRL